MNYSLFEFGQIDGLLTETVVFLEFLLNSLDFILVGKFGDHMGILIPEPGVGAVFGYLGRGALSPGRV